METRNYISSLSDLQRHVSDISIGFDAKFYGITHDQMIHEFTENLLDHINKTGFRWGDELPEITDKAWFEITNIKDEFARLIDTHGEFVYEDRILTLKHQPYISGFAGIDAAYYADARDSNYNDYQIKWKITNEDCEDESEACDWTKYTVKKEDKMTPFTNESIFQGIVQYKDESGNEWRREHDKPSFKFYELENGSFIYRGAINVKNNRMGIQETHEMFIESLD